MLNLEHRLKRKSMRVATSWVCSEASTRRLPSMICRSREPFADAVSDTLTFFFVS